MFHLSGRLSHTSAGGLNASCVAAQHSFLLSMSFNYFHPVLREPTISSNNDTII